MGGGSSKQTTRDILDPKFKALRGPVADVFGEEGGLIDQTREAGAGFGGPLVAPLTEAERGLVGEISGFDGAPTAAQTAAEKSRLATIRGERLTPGEQFEPFARQIREQFQEAQLESVGQFTGAGQRVQDSSPFARASAITSRALGDALARTAADIFKTERGFQETAAAQEETQVATRAQAKGVQIENLVNRLSASALPRLISDLGIERGMEEFSRRMEQLLNILGLGVQATSPALASFGKSVNATI